MPRKLVLGELPKLVVLHRRRSHWLESSSGVAVRSIPAWHYHHYASYASSSACSPRSAQRWTHPSWPERTLGGRHRDSIGPPSRVSLDPTNLPDHGSRCLASRLTVSLNARASECTLRRERANLPFVPVPGWSFAAAVRRPSHLISVISRHGAIKGSRLSRRLQHVAPELRNGSSKDAVPRCRGPRHELPVTRQLTHCKPAYPPLARRRVMRSRTSARPND